MNIVQRDLIDACIASRYIEHSQRRVINRLIENDV